VRHDAGRTLVSITLAPGETALLTLDRGAGGASGSAPARTQTVAEPAEWDIAVESWDAGDAVVVEEDRGLGYVSREVRPTTAVTRLDAGRGPLRPWDQLAEVGPEVSGVGEYTTTLRLDEEVREGERYVLDLGSTAGGLGAVRINGRAVKGFDTSRPVVDVTEDLRAGDNEVTVRVASSLNNRLLARGYYDRIPDIMLMIAGQEHTQQTQVHAHGLLGPVRLLRETAA
jgi:hypothetical protein